MTGEALRPEATPEPGAPTDVLVLPDTFLLTENGGEQLAVPRLTVVMDTSGLTVLKSDGMAAAAMTWSDISVVRTSGRMRTPEGAPGVVVEAVTATKTHRFMVPTGDPDGLEQQVSHMAERTGGRRRRRGATRSTKRSWWRRKSR